MTGAGQAQPLHRLGWTSGVALGLLLLLAWGVRLHGINQSLVTFHPTRHYRSAVIARACYYDATPSTPGWARDLARAARSMQPTGEPPFMEWVACASYRALGREDVRIPRVVVMLCWILGALPLYRLASRFCSPPFALVAAALYLFMPYGIVATRSFQPDAPMTLCALLAALAAARYFESPVASRLAAAALLVGLATVVKPMSVFLTFPALIGLARARQPWSQVIVDRKLAMLVLLGFLPATIYYGYGAVFGTLGRDQMRMRFVPALLASSFFWSGWLTQIRRVFDLPLFFLALLASVAAPRPGARAVMTAWWIGYATFAVAFTYHMPTHDYYHLPYVAIVAIGVAATLARLEPWFEARFDSRALAARGANPAAFDARGIPGDGVATRSNTAGILARLHPTAHNTRGGDPGRALSAGRLPRLGARRDLHHGLLGAGACAVAAGIAAWGTMQAWPRLTHPRASATVAAYERIGELTNHHPNVLFLDLDYGYALMYHGQLSGDAWPNSDDLTAERLGGSVPISAQARFERDFARVEPAYFVVTDLASLEAQVDLRDMLDQRVTVVEKTPAYHVYRFKLQ